MKSFKIPAILYWPQPIHVSEYIGAEQIERTNFLIWAAKLHNAEANERSGLLWIVSIYQLQGKDIKQING